MGGGGGGQLKTELVLLCVCVLRPLLLPLLQVIQIITEITLVLQ